MEAKKGANVDEVALHDAAIESLANEMGRPIAEIKLHYEREYSRLEEGARLRDFLSVCAARHTREALRHSHRSRHGASSALAAIVPAATQEVFRT